MSEKVKNILIVVVVIGILSAAYFFFFKKNNDTALISDGSSVDAGALANSGLSNQDKDLLSLISNMKNIKIDSSLLSSSNFTNLKENSIVLVPDGKEGRVNPFAPIGVEPVENTISLDMANMAQESIVSTDNVLDSQGIKNTVDVIAPKGSTTKSEVKTN